MIDKLDNGNLKCKVEVDSQPIHSQDRLTYKWYCGKKLQTGKDKAELEQVDVEKVQKYRCEVRYHLPDWPKDVIVKSTRKQCKWNS